MKFFCELLILKFQEVYFLKEELISKVCKKVSSKLEENIPLEHSATRKIYFNASENSTHVI